VERLNATFARVGSSGEIMEAQGVRDATTKHGPRPCSATSPVDAAWINRSPNMAALYREKISVPTYIANATS
jgi:hypothetical protein